MKPSVRERPAVTTMLESIPLFGGLGERALAKLVKGARALDVVRGTELFRRGDAPAGIYGVVSGRIKLSLPGTDGNEKVFALIGRGETFGEPGVLLDEPHVACAETLQPASLVFVERNLVLACMARDAAFANRMALTLCRRLRRLMREIENSTLHSGTERVVDFLVNELTEAPSHGAAIVELPAKKRIIASRLDLTHEHFSRILHDLAAARLLVVQGPRVSIPDIARLRAYHEESYAPAAEAARTGSS